MKEPSRAGPLTPPRPPQSQSAVPGHPLKVLIVEDNPNDTTLIVEELRAGGFDVQWTRVESYAAMFESLTEGVDLVLLDYGVPGMSVVQALKALREFNLDAPVIVVSGSIGEKEAVETLREGAVDYIWKDRLRRLPDAVTRALELKSAERALKESERRYRSMFEGNSVPMWVYDVATLEFLAVNSAAVEHYGYSEAEFLRMTLRDIRHPDDQAALSSGLATAMEAAERAHTTFVVHHRKKDGTQIDVCVSSHSMVFAGRPARLVLATDETEKNRTVEALRESEERFRRIAETIAEVVWIADAGVETLAYLSPAYEKIWGRSLESLYTNPRSFLESVHPDDRQGVSVTLKKQDEGAPFDHEYRIIRPDGEVRWIWGRGYPVQDDRRRLVQYVGVSQDITPRRRAEEALREGEERMRLALAASRVGVWDTNLWTRATYWSEVCEAIHGLEPGTFGKTFDAFLALVHPEDKEQVLKAIDQAVRDHSQVEFEYRTRRPDGAERVINCTADFFYNDEGVPVRGAGISTDVTERRSLETQLRQAQKMEAVGELAGGVAHDFNNLLTAILGYGELLVPHFEKGGEGLKDLEQVRKAATRATHLTRQLLAFSRRQILKPVVLDVNHVANDLAGMLRRLISEDILIDLRLEQGIGFVTADRGQIEQVIMNLVVNARDAMPQGGTLTVETANVDVDEEFFKGQGIDAREMRRRWVMLSVADTGIGMDPVTKNRIFEPFFTTKPTGKGTGLGLATVYGIVKQSGGYIWVYTEPGAGATFKIYLPRTDDTPAPEAAPVAHVASARGGEVVLLVEDEETVRTLVHTMLERQGYTVIEASHSEHAMRLARERGTGIDLLLTDVVMPGKSGPELFADLRDEWPAMRVLYMSGYADEAIVRRGVLQPGTHFIQKPFTASAFMQKIRESLDAAGPAS